MEIAPLGPCLGCCYNEIIRNITSKEVSTTRFSQKTLGFPNGEFSSNNFIHSRKCVATSEEWPQLPSFTLENPQSALHPVGFSITVKTWSFSITLYPSVNFHTVQFVSLQGKWVCQKWSSEIGQVQFLLPSPLAQMPTSTLVWHALPSVLCLSKSYLPGILRVPREKP